MFFIILIPPINMFINSREPELGLDLKRVSQNAGKNRRERDFKELLFSLPMINETVKVESQGALNGHIHIIQLADTPHLRQVQSQLIPYACRFLTKGYGAF